MEKMELLGFRLQSFTLWSYPISYPRDYITFHTHYELSCSTSLRERKEFRPLLNDIQSSLEYQHRRFFGTVAEVVGGDTRKISGVTMPFLYLDK